MLIRFFIDPLLMLLNRHGDFLVNALLVVIMSRSVGVILVVATEGMKTTTIEE
jgi:hypothetical protein